MRSSDMSSDENDRETQAEILATLNKYGDSFLGDEPSRKSKIATKKRKKLNEVLENDTTSKKSSKRRRRKAPKCESSDLSDITVSHEEFEDSDVDDRVKIDGAELSSEQRHLEDLKRKLGLTSADFMLKKQRKPDETKSQSKTSRKKGEPEIIVFNDPAKRKQNSAQPSSQPKKKIRRDSIESDANSDDDSLRPRNKKSNDTVPDDNFDMKRAKFDVMMLGIKGLDKVNKEKARIDFAVKLGAKPPKRKYINYKQFQEEKRKEKIEAQTEILEARESGDQISKSNFRKRRQRDKNDIGFLDGQVGKYKSGVQVLHKNDLKKLTSAPGSGRRGRGGRGRGGRR